MSRVLVLVQDEDVRQLVCQLLGKRHEVLLSATRDATDSDFDLAILDHTHFNDRVEWVRRCKTAAHPVFLPFLLLVPELEETIASGKSWRRVDETIFQPIERSVLLRRVTTLLATRQLSLDFQEQNAELEHRYREQTALQRRLVGKNIEMQGLNLEKDQWLGTAAHDLRIPLGVIHFYSQLLLEEPETLNPDQREFITRIESSSRYMRQLIDDMLDLTGIESGKLQLRLQMLDLGDLLAHNAEFHRPLAAQKKISIETGIEGEQVRIMADPDRLIQVLNNLVNNAVKFSHAGDCIRITAKTVERCARIAVEDEGCGIAAARLPQLFKPFNPGTRGTAGEQSTGLGLAIVRKIVEAQNGKVGVESQEGKGSVFWIDLPLAVAAPSAVSLGRQWAPQGEIFDSVSALARYVGDTEALGHAVALLRKNAAQSLGALQDSIAQHNTRGLAHGAYLLSRLLSDLSAERALEAALRLQKIGRSGNLEDAERVYAVLALEMKQLETRLCKEGW